MCFQVEQAIDNKTELILFAASNCRTDSRREVIIERLQEMIAITAVGDCYNATCDEECLIGLEGGFLGWILRNLVLDAGLV